MKPPLGPGSGSSEESEAFQSLESRIKSARRPGCAIHPEETRRECPIEVHLNVDEGPLRNMLFNRQILNGFKVDHLH